MPDVGVATAHLEGYSSICSEGNQCDARPLSALSSASFLVPLREDMFASLSQATKDQMKGVMRLYMQAGLPTMSIACLLIELRSNNAMHSLQGSTVADPAIDWSQL